jgi:hypothetical protein
MFCVMDPGTRVPTLDRFDDSQEDSSDLFPEVASLIKVLAFPSSSIPFKSP